MEEITIYVLTHKEFDEKYDKELYKPLLNGSYYNSENLKYIRDDTGDNISKLNNYYAELTGQYWAWKNSNVKIIGFVHYRRWFARNLKFDKLTKQDILQDLKNHDIILPQKTRVKGSVKETIIRDLKKYPDYGAKWEDYLKLENIIKTKFPEYYQSYIHIMNHTSLYNNNMFICEFELANKYFTYLFKILDEMKNEIDFTQYPDNNKRVLGFFSEVLLTVFVHKHDLKIKEHYLLFSGRKIPLVYAINRRFPSIEQIERKIVKIIK